MFDPVKNAKERLGQIPGIPVHTGPKRDQKSKISLIDYTKTAVEERELETIEEAFVYKHVDSVTWVNVDGLEDVDLINKLTTHYDIHPLVVEDILTTNHRPKIEDHEKYIFFILKMLYLDDIKKEIPQLKDLPEYNFYTGRMFEYTDNLNYYYLKIKEIKIKNALSPVNFESKNIKNILLNQRKMQLIKQYKQQLLEKAKTDNSLRYF